MLGLIIIALAGFNVDFPNKGLWLGLSIVAMTLGVILYSKGLYDAKQAGI